MDVELRLGAWGGLPNYGCPYCPFDSLNQAIALEHVFEVHTFQSQPKPPHGKLFDHEGNLVIATSR